MESYSCEMDGKKIDITVVLEEKVVEPPTDDGIDQIYAVIVCL